MTNTLILEEWQSQSRAYIAKAQRSDWETPITLFEKLWDEFGPFDCDPAAQDGQHSAERIWEAGGEYMIPPPLHEGEPSGISGPAYYPSATNKEERVYFDGLKMSWHGHVFLNPPYGARSIPIWVEKAVSEVGKGADSTCSLVCALLPARTDTRWFQNYCLKEVAFVEGLIRFLPGRLKFGGANGPAPFPSMIVVWRR